MRENLVKADRNNGEVERQVDHHQKHRDSDGFLEAAQEDRAQRGDQNERHNDAMMQKIKVLQHKRIFDDVGGSVCG